MSPQGQKKSLISVGIDLTVHLVYLKYIYWVLRSIGSALLNFHACRKNLCYPTESYGCFITTIRQNAMIVDR